MHLAKPRSSLSKGLEKSSAPPQSPRLQRILLPLLRSYLHVYHRMEVNFSPAVPSRGPFLALTTHFSMLDVIALMVADPDHPRNVMVVKESLFGIPIVALCLRAWGAIPVARSGKDIAAIRSILAVLREGRGICIAAEGTRSRTGRLGSLSPVLVKLALMVAREDIPVVPVAELGTFEAFPPGAWLPRPRKVTVVARGPMDLTPWRVGKIGPQELSEAAFLIQDALASLLPEWQRPLPGTPALAPPG